ncbi:MAG: hypothetical protein A2020_15190 [Lentisphaerae bacterium GWF2_45_14]|nr:MAG: hypothetical protein A2020_15190 [Lentisphaerae bacterium GWF2_45_14]
MDKIIQNEFLNPEASYRGAPFWAWNGKLEEDELRRQIRIMHQMGLGGFFMHSRVGLDTAYLSDEWFDRIKACIDEAEKLGMNAWLYDEDRWPSGAAGGLVTKNPDYRARSIVMKENGTASPETIAIFAAEMENGKIKNYRKIKSGEKISSKEKVLEFHIETQAESSWYNGQTYLDTLSHDAVKEFIKVTHEAYRKKIASKFGKSVPGIFTDEPNFIAAFHEDEKIIKNAWTKKLPEIFEKRYGYDIIDVLPEIFLDTKDSSFSKVRWNYFDCVTFLFADAFARQIGEWCTKNNMLHTGHALHEDTLSAQTCMAGSAMRSYEYMQAPGMDLLTEHWRVYNTAKQVSSAANQFGAKWRLTETYGCTGWDFPFAGHKALGDWQAALGINLRCQHLAWYTMQGEAKRDYPASIFYQSPWWESYSKVENYFARINYVMTKGSEVRNLLVIHPIESMWGTISKGWREDKEVAEMDTNFFRTSDFLLGANIDFDFGDEDIISRHAKIEKVGGKAKFTINKASYSTILVPPLKTIRKTTLALLETFVNAGGKVTFAGKAPEFVNGEKSDAAAKFADKTAIIPYSEKAIVKAVESNARTLSITDTDGKELSRVLYLLKEDKENFYLFICNTGHMKNPPSAMAEPSMVRDRKKVYPEAFVNIFMNAAGSVLELDPDTGKIYSADSKTSSGCVKIKTSFDELGSRLFLIPKKKKVSSFSARPSFKKECTLAINKKSWQVSTSEQNVLALDYPSLRIGPNGKWTKPDEILRVDSKVRDFLGTLRRGGRMVQPWARVKNHDPKKTPIGLSYKFEVKNVPSGTVSLAIEKPETFKIAVNGNALSSDSASGFWCDRSLKTIPFSGNLLKKGINEISLECDFTEEHPGLEIIYLLGDFSVKISGNKPTVNTPVRELKTGDWTKQGFPFYSGNMTYITTVKLTKSAKEKVFVKIPSYRGVAVAVYVNGEKAGITAWAPGEVDISSVVQIGSNEIRIEIMGHRRNSHGPLHYSEKWPMWTGPAQYISEGKGWSDKYNLVPCGLMENPLLLVRI